MRLGTRRRSGNERVKTEKQMFKGCQIYIKIFALLSNCQLSNSNEISENSENCFVRLPTARLNDSRLADCRPATIA